MTDAELIYNACLRAERRLEEIMGLNAETEKMRSPLAVGAFAALRALREEIGNGLAAR